MKAFARQVDPVLQSSPLFYDEFPDNISVFGNQRYKEHITDEMEHVLKVLKDGELAFVLDTLCAGEPKSDAIQDYLPPVVRKEYGVGEIESLGSLVDRYSVCSSSEEPEILCAVMSIVTGKDWDYRNICGCCQGEWNQVYYLKDEWDEEALDFFEAEYFNTGTEWHVDIGYNEPDPEDIGGFDLYCVGSNIDEIKREIADAAGVQDSDVVLFLHKGYTKTPIYEKV